MRVRSAFLRLMPLPFVWVTERLMTLGMFTTNVDRNLKEKLSRILPQQTKQMSNKNKLKHSVKLVLHVEKDIYL
jgi:hypothetical protein